MTTQTDSTNENASTVTNENVEAIEISSRPFGALDVALAAVSAAVVAGVCYLGYKALTGQTFLDEDSAEKAANAMIDNADMMSGTVVKQTVEVIKDTVLNVTDATGYVVGKVVDGKVVNS